jgi:hypothetical protein
MKPAERIPLLRKVATALFDEETPWRETALILRQFGFTSHVVSWSQSFRWFCNLES